MGWERDEGVSLVQRRRMAGRVQVRGGEDAQHVGLQGWPLLYHLVVTGPQCKSCTAPEKHDSRAATTEYSRAIAWHKGCRCMYADGPHHCTAFKCKLPFVITTGRCRNLTHLLFATPLLPPQTGPSQSAPRCWQNQQQPLAWTGCRTTCRGCPGLQTQSLVQSSQTP